MKFVSNAAQTPRPVALQDVVEVQVNGRSLLAATAQGHLMGTEVQMEGGAAALEHLTLLARLSDPQAQVVHAELDTPELAAVQMSKVMDVLPDGGAVIFLCRDASVLEAADELLHIHRDSGPHTRH